MPIKDLIFVSDLILISKLNKGYKPELIHEWNDLVIMSNIDKNVNLSSSAKFGLLSIYTLYVNLEEVFDLVSKGMKEVIVLPSNCLWLEHDSLNSL